MHHNTTITVEKIMIDFCDFANQVGRVRGLAYTVQKKTRYGIRYMYEYVLEVHFFIHMGSVHCLLHTHV